MTRRHNDCSAVNLNTTTALKHSGKQQAGVVMNETGQRSEPDGWTWSDPHWRDRVSSSSLLAMGVEAVRRGIDLRDVIATGQCDAKTSLRAVLLLDTLNELLAYAVEERARALDITPAIPSGTGYEIALDLLDNELLTSEEYRPT
jgi:hypothetical protein